MKKDFSKTSTGAIILAVIACILWSGNFVFARGADGWINPVGFAFWRWVIAFTVMLFIARKHIKPGIEILRSDGKVHIAAMGVISVGIYNTLVYRAGHFTSANSIALLAATSPIWTMLLAGVFNLEPLNRFKVAGVFVAFLGALNVILKGNFADIVHLEFNNGDMLMFVASWLWAIYSLMLKKKPKAMHPSFFLLAIIFYGLLVLTPLYILELIYVGHTPLTLKVLGAYFYVGLGASVVAWMFFNNAVQVIGAIRTSIIYYSMPIFTGVVSVFTINEHLQHYHIVGFALVFAGILISNRKVRSQQ